MRAALLAVAAAVVVVLLAPATARAHAFLIRADPAPSSVVKAPPSRVRLVFSEPVRPAAGIKVLRAGGVSVTAGRAFVPPDRPNEIDIPLRHGLGPGPYAVTWSEVDLEDGHVISGAFVFSIGAGFLPTQIASAQGTNDASLQAVISRWVLLAGLLVAAGSVAFWFLVSRPVLGPRADRASTLVLAGALGVATLGALLTVLLGSDTATTRFGHRTWIGAGVAAVGALLALASLRRPQLRVPASVLAVVLLALPTATGHASVAGVTRAVSIPADLLHLAAAAVWIAGVAALAVLAPLVLRGVEQPQRRALHVALARRFTPLAIVAVAVLGASGVVRAFNELDAFRQLWTTGYGQALLVKTGLFAVLLVLAWLNRRRLASVRVAAELVLLAVVIGAVAVLTNLRPGRAEPALASTASQTVVYAGRAGNMAVGLAVTPQSGGAVALRATVLGLDGRVAGLKVRFGVDGVQSDGTACGAGCYGAAVGHAPRPRHVSLQIAGYPRLRFATPAQWPARDATEIVRRAEDVIGSLRTMVVHSRLASDATHEVTTTYTMQAPDRLSYHNAGGSDSIIIGNRRWDRQNGGARWIESPQLPAIQQPAPFWPEGITDAHVLRADRVDGRPVWVVSFLDPGTPAWFTASIDRSSYQTLRLDMVAAAHFMHNTNGPFDAPVSVRPPGP